MERRTLRTLWGCAGACRALLAFTHLGPAEDRLANEQQQNQKFRRELLIFRDAKDAFLVCDVLCPLLLHEKLVPAMVSVERPCCVRNTRDVWPSCYSCVPSRRTRPCCLLCAWCCSAERRWWGAKNEQMEGAGLARAAISETGMNNFIVSVFSLNEMETAIPSGSSMKRSLRHHGMRT